MTIRVLWTWNGSDIEYKDFKNIDDAEEYRDKLESRGAGVQRLIRV